MVEQKVDSEISGQETEPESTLSLLELKPKMKVAGKVQRLELYGAFIDIGLDVPAILHISKLDKRVNRVSDALAVGDEITVWIDAIEVQRDQVTVTMVPPLAVEWYDLKKGQIYSGTVTRLEKFGAFVDIGAEKEGLVHVSELSFDYVKHPSEVVSTGDEIEVVVLGFNKRKRRIDLSRKAMLEIKEAQSEEAEEEEEELEEVMPTSMEIAMKRAMDDPAETATGAAESAKKMGSLGKKEALDDILSRTLKLNKETDS